MLQAMAGFLSLSLNLYELRRKLSRYCSQDIVRHSFEKYVVFSCSEFKDNQYRFNFGENGGTTIKAILRKSQMRLLARKLYSQLLLLEFRPLWQAHTEGSSCVRGLFGRLWCLVAPLNFCVLRRDQKIPKSRTMKKLNCQKALA